MRASMYSENSTGTNTDPCGTPDSRRPEEERRSSQQSSYLESVFITGALVLNDVVNRIKCTCEVKIFLESRN